MIGSIGANLISAFIGFLFGRGYDFGKSAYWNRTVKWFWAPAPSEKLYLHFGHWDCQISSMGEMEPMMNVPGALGLGELVTFLRPFYRDIVRTTDESVIDWQFPVISFGGPLVNSLTKKMGDRGMLPLWFLDMPYSKDSERALGTQGRTEVFKSEFDDEGKLVSDVGFAAKLRSFQNEDQFLYVIAGNYGYGILGVVRHLTSLKNLRHLRSAVQSQFFELIIRSRISEKDVTDTRLLQYRGLD